MLPLATADNKIVTWYIFDIVNLHISSFDKEIIQYTVTQHETLNSTIIQSAASIITHRATDGSGCFVWFKYSYQDLVGSRQGESRRSLMH